MRTGILSWGPYSVFKWSVIAKLCRAKLFFVSVGAGPFYSRMGKRLVRTALSLANFRSYRDESTVQRLQAIGFPANKDRVFPDLAFSLPEAVIPGQSANTGRRPIVGLGLMMMRGNIATANLPALPMQPTSRHLQNFQRGCWPVDMMSGY